MTIIHPADFIDSYLQICTDEAKFAEQTLEAFNIASTTGAALDCAVGTGFGTIRLLRQGHSIVCSDGSQEMLERFQQNCSRNGLQNRSICARWSNLGAFFPGVFELVMCRGNSLTYADSWDVPADQATMMSGLANVAKHLDGMVAAIRPGGSLLVDLPRATEADAKTYVHSGTTVDGRPTTISETITINRQRRQRHWSMQMRTGADTVHFERSSYLVSALDIVPILRRCGFRTVVSFPQIGIRDHYDSLLAIDLSRAD